MVFGDANRLQQAIWNLLSNAVKFTNEGGRIEARLGRAGGQIEITVSDTGIGIDLRFLPHVFDRFRQADSTSTREVWRPGSRPGHRASHRRDARRQRLGFKPRQRSGGDIQVRLPLEFQRATAATGIGAAAIRSDNSANGRQQPQESGQRLDGVRVLVVEDNPDTLDMLKFIFDECGAEVITAASANEALEALERFAPDALVSDIAMPDQDGYELIRQLRSRGPERGGNIPAVALTAYARAEDRVRALAAGFQCTSPNRLTLKSWSPLWQA